MSIFLIHRLFKSNHLGPVDLSRLNFVRTQSATFINKQKKPANWLVYLIWLNPYYA